MLTDRDGMRAERDFAPATESVPAARRMVRDALAEWRRDAVEDAATLVVTELVTNAVLHARPPIRVAVEPLGCDGIRIEVHDGSPVPPLRPRADEGSTTGRGLGLVEGLSHRWGTEPTAEGKYVWVELLPSDTPPVLLPPAATGGEGALDALESWADLLEDSAPERYTVSLGDVPTDLLLAAKAHVDALVRELTLTASGAASGVTEALPAHLAALVRDVVEEFAEARHSIKRQALAAANRGDERTTLTLTLPASAADAGERYLAGLEEADRYAQTARLLTLAAPPQHQLFREWYVTSLVDALRANSEGRPRRPVATFESHLLRAVDVLAELQRKSALTVRLHSAAQRLVTASGLGEVAAAALDDAVVELDALGGAVLLADGRVLHPLAVRGSATTTYAAPRVPVSTPTPGAQAHVTGHAVWVESREERLEAYPDLPAAVSAVCALPLLVAGHSIGVLELHLDESRLLGTDERAFLTSLAAVAAQTLDRVRLDDSRTRVVQRLTRLQAVTTALSRVRDLDAVLDVVVGHAIGLVGAHTVSVSLLDPDGRTLRLVRVAPDLPGAQEQWSSFLLDDPVPAAEALRTGEPVWVPSVEERDARWPRLADVGPTGPHGLALIPLHVEESVLGTLSLSFTAEEGKEEVEEPAWEFLLAFADACAQAFDRARTAERVERANRKLAFLADVTDLLGETSDLERTLRAVARVAVPELTDWCAVHLLDDGRLRMVALEHVDPARRAQAREVLDQWPVDLSDATGIARVVRDRVPMLVADVPRGWRDVERASRTPAARDPATDPAPPRMEALRALGLESVLSVPLLARGRTLGAVTLLTAESGRHYGPDDLAFVQDLARRIAVGVDNARLFAALDAQTTGTAYRIGQAEGADRLARVLETMVDAFFRVDPDWRFTYVNSEAERLLLRRREELLGRTMRDAFPDILGSVFEEHYQQAMSTGLPVSFEAHYAPLAIWVEVRANPDPDGLSVFFHRVDERKAAEAERRRANERLEVVAAASSRFAGLLDPDQVLDVLVDVVVPELGPYATVSLRADLAGALTGGRPGRSEDEVQVVRIRHEDRDREEAMLGFLRQLRLTTSDRYGAGAVTGSGQPQELREITDEVFRTVAGDDAETLARLRAVGPTSGYTVPLISRRRTLGAISVGEPRKGDLDRSLLTELAARAAVALDNALLYRAEWLKGIELQRQLLPRVVPRVAGVAVATRYLPSVRGALTGGDFYEALEVEGGLLLALGDVMGHGMRSAARMGQLRAIVAALALQGLDPATLLGRIAADVDRMLDLGLATLLIGRYDQRDRTLTVASAGHPPPLLAPRCGEAAYLDVEPGPPLGVPLDGALFAASTVTVPSRANLVLFTDGLVEDRDQSITTGLERLRAAASHVDLRPDAMADRLLDATGRVRGGRDDVALLVLQHE